MAFTVELADLEGEPLGQPAWRELVLDRALNGGAVCACVIANDVQAAAFARLGRTVLRVWQDGVLRFHGRLREPLVATPGQVAVTAGSPYTLLDRRQVQAAITYAQWDQGTIILDQLQNQQDPRSPTGLRVRQPYPASVLRDRTYEAGKSVQEVIGQLAAVEHGPFFLERPVLERSSPSVYCELELRWPAAGQDRPGVRFEYGEGTIGNVASYTLTQLLPVNGVHYVGGGIPGVAGDEGDPEAVPPVPPTPAVPEVPPPVVHVYDPDSFNTYRLLEQWHSDPDVTDAATLGEKARERLRPDPRYIVGLELVAGGPALGAPPVPRLWHEFDLGDTVYASVRDATTEAYDLPLMVTAARLAASAEDDSEALELTLQPPGEEGGEG